VTVFSMPSRSTVTTSSSVHSSGILRPNALFLNRPATLAAAQLLHHSEGASGRGCPRRNGLGRIVGARVFRPWRAQVVEEHPAAVLVGVEVDGIATDGTLGVGIDVAPGNCARRIAL
jgi:hypothetical protein